MKIVEEVPARTERFKKSPIPAMARIINENAEAVLERRARMKFEDCKSTFIDIANLEKHLKIKHPEKWTETEAEAIAVNELETTVEIGEDEARKKFTCDQCGKNFRRARDMKYHNYFKHNSM